MPATTYIFDAAEPRRRDRALADLDSGLRHWRLPVALAALDIRNRYRGSVLGPFWMTLSTAVMVAGLGLLYSSLFKMSLVEYLPFLAVSLIIWNTINQVVADACTSLTSSEGIIRQLPLPYSVHVLRCVWRNAVIAAHSLPIILVVFAATGVWPGWGGLLAIPGLALLGVNACALALFLGMLCARFRDIPPIVGSVMQLAFFLSPVLWRPELLHGTARAFLPLNPFYVVMETIRGPLVEGGAPAIVWVSAIVYTALAAALAFVFFVRFRGRIAFWV
ncbi:ABC transporter permease [Belnapia sp. T6]|uniref:ABC transporter permease n=1 Tax=Belnapia mucosa TaxID=2804532 RepID=A0ABS1V1C9_9PROT|nr:ABC transporter permease [Belnapia mucosa]MBL6455505.1 ABC transporter permease [Belnapia mucosa]